MEFQPNRKPTPLALSPQQRYERAQQAARALGFSSDYERRRARLAALGTTPTAQRKARWAVTGQKRDYFAEGVRREQLARQRGFVSSSQERRVKKQGLTGKALEAQQRKAMLKLFGMSEAQFNRIRKENRLWAREYPMLQYTAINTYDMAVDGAIHDWSEQRVGYIIYFHAAIVAPATNYDSLKPNPRYYKGGPYGRKEMTKEQFYYLVKYANIMSVNEYEARYGRVLPG